MTESNNEPHTMLNQIPISPEEFKDLTSLIYDTFGIILSDEKKSMVMGRLQKYMRTNSYRSYSEYLDHLKCGDNQQALSALIDNISTNHTYFWREHEHFDYLEQTALPAITSKLTGASKDLRVWCAGCSTGEEAYTIMISILEHLGSSYSKWNAGLLATDISEKVLNIAMEGKYAQDQVDKIPAAIRNKYFKEIASDTWQIKEAAKKEITFRRFNLMNKELPFKKQFHIIFCRNVMIYFDLPTKERIVNNFANFLMPGGYFFIGHSESLGRSQSNLEYIMPSVYRKR